MGKNFSYKTIVFDFEIFIIKEKIKKGFYYATK